MSRYARKKPFDRTQFPMGRSPAVDAFKSLKPGEMVEVPCKWRHTGGKSSVCMGVFAVYKAAQKMGVKVTFGHTSTDLVIGRPPEEPGQELE